MLLPPESHRGNKPSLVHAFEDCAQPVLAAELGRVRAYEPSEVAPAACSPALQRTPPHPQADGAAVLLYGKWSAAATCAAAGLLVTFLAPVCALFIPSVHVRIGWEQSGIELMLLSLIQPPKLGRGDPGGLKEARKTTQAGMPTLASSRPWVRYTSLPLVLRAASQRDASCLSQAQRLLKDTKQGRERLAPLGFEQGQQNN